jgi:hypothetical protein
MLEIQLIENVYGRQVHGEKAKLFPSRDLTGKGFT